MASTYTVNLGIEKIGTGEQSGTWGTTTNTNLDLIDQAVNGAVTVTLASAGTSGSPNTLEITNGAVSDGRNKFIEFNDGGDLGATAYVQLTPNDAEKLVHIRNSLSGGRTLILFQGTYNASNDFEVPNGKDVVLKFDGAGASATVTQVFEDLLVTAVAATTVDTTNIEVTNLKAKDGTAAGSIADSTGVVTIASSVLTTTDINGGTIDGVTIGGSSAGAGTFTNLTATGTTTLAGASTTADITFGDNDKAIFGAGSDLEIYHDGTRNYIDSGATELRLQTSELRMVNSANTEIGLKAVEDGAVTLYYDANAKLATTATGIDVTGTVTADGLTVDGTATVNSNIFEVSATTPNIRLTETDVTGENTQLLQSGGNFRIRTASDDYGTTTERMRIDHATGDISFYEDTGTTPKFFWDASAEVLGVGTASPTSDADLHVSPSSGNAIIRLEGASAEYWNIIGATNDKLILSNSTDGNVFVIENGNVGIGTNSPATALDVNGTVTADGLTIDGGNTLRLDAASTTDFFTIIQGGTQAVLTADSPDGASNMLFKTAASGVDTSRMQIAGGGDISFYDSSGTSESFYWDASAERLGIGTTSPGATLDVNGTIRADGLEFRNEGETITFETSGGATATIKTGDAVATNSLQIEADNTITLNSGQDDTGGSSDNVVISRGSTYTITALFDAVGDISFYEDTGTTPKFFWDASAESLGIGTTTTPNTLAGASATQGLAFNGSTGYLVAAASGTATAYFNRQTSDGTIAEFRKDGTTVGSIGTRVDALFIHSPDGTNGSGLKLSDGVMVPCNSDGTGSDNDTDFGNSGARFKNLYLSGGVYLGGTGAANLLDDYEEGTWTGKVADAASGGNESSSNVYGYYTKVGNMVYVHFNTSNINTTGLTAGNDVYITGLPFTSASVTGNAKYTGTALMSVVTFAETPILNMNESDTVLQIAEVRSGAGVDFVTVSQLNSGSSDIHGNLVYQTA